MKGLFWTALFLFSIGNLSLIIFKEYFNETIHYSEEINCNKLTISSSWLENKLFSYNAIAVKVSQKEEYFDRCNTKYLLRFGYGEDRSERIENVQQVDWPVKDSLVIISQLINGRVDTFTRCLQGP